MLADACLLAHTFLPVRSKHATQLMDIQSLRPAGLEILMYRTRRLEAMPLSTSATTEEATDPESPVTGSTLSPAGGRLAACMATVWDRAASKASSPSRGRVGAANASAPSDASRAKTKIRFMLNGVCSAAICGRRAAFSCARLAAATPSITQRNARLCVLCRATQANGRR